MLRIQFVSRFQLVAGRSANPSIPKVEEMPSGSDRMVG